MTAVLPQTVRVAKLCASLTPKKFDEVVRIVRDLEDELRAVRCGRNVLLEINRDYAAEGDEQGRAVQAGYFVELIEIGDLRPPDDAPES